MGFLGKLWNAVMYWFCWTAWVTLLLIAVDSAIKGKLYTVFDGIIWLMLFSLFSFASYMILKEDIKDEF